MKDFLLDKLGDIVLTNDLTHVNGPEEIAQSVRVILSTRLSEFELEPSLGLMHDNLLGKNLNIDYLKQDISETVLLQESRITSIEAIQIIKLEKRGLHINIKMLAENEEVEVEIIA